MNIFKGDLDNVIFLKKYSIIKFLPWLWLLLCFSLTVFKILFNIRYLLDSDLSNELYLGRVLAKEGHWVLSNNWFYSQDLRVLNMQIIFGILFRLTGDFHIVRFLGTLIGYLIWLASLYYLMYELELKKKFPIVAGFLFIPYSASYEWIYLAGTTYIPFAVISFLSLALLIHCIKLTEDKKYKRYIIQICLYLLAFISGLAGFRQLLILYIPMFVASLLIYIYFEVTKNEKKTTSLYLLRTFIVTLMSFSGCIVNILMLSKIYKFATWSELKWDVLSAEKFFNIINNWLYAFGYRADNKVLSFSLFANVFAIIIAGLVVCSVIYIKYSITNFSFDLYFITFSIIAAIIFSILNLFTDLQVTDRYFNQIIIYFPISFIIIYSQLRVREFISLSAIVLICFLAILTGLNLYNRRLGNSLLFADNGDLYKKIEISNFLVYNGYESGYATYWNSGVMQELSNGKLKMYTLNPSANSISQVWDYLQEKEHISKSPSGKVFFILKNDDEETVKSLGKSFPDNHIIYTLDDYTVYGYNSYDDMSRDVLWDKINLGENRIKVSKSVFRTECKSLGDEIISDGIDSSVMYGPYMKMPVGKYNITYKYTSSAELPAGTIIGTADIYDTNYPDDLSLEYKTELLSDATEVTISNIELKEDCEMFEIRIFSSIAGVKPEEIIIQKLE